MSTDVSYDDVYFGNDHTLELENLAANGILENAATITFQIYDMDDSAVSGASGSLTISGTGGDYFGTVSSSVVGLLDRGEMYRIKVTGVDSNNNNFEFNAFITPKHRGKT